MKRTRLTQSKKLGIWTLTALVTGNMIGSGIFLLPSTLASLGTISLYSWLFSTAGALLLALMFAKLSMQLPKTGGPYAYTKAGLGNFLGFQTAYSYWIALWVGNAAIVLAGVGYASVFWPTLANPKVACLAAIIIIWLFTFINILGVQTAGIVQLVTTVLKLIPILLIGILGWFFIHPQYFHQFYNTSTPHQSDFFVISAGATLTFWSFIGLESATVPADSVNNPTRTIPIATILGTLIAGLAYILSSSAIILMIPATVLQHSNAPFSAAGEIIFGHFIGKYLITIGALVSCLGCLNGWVLLQGQVAMAAADDQLFPKLFAHRNKRGVPAIGLIITAGLITALLLLTISPSLVKQFQIIILLAVLATLIPYLYTAMADITLLQTEKSKKISFLIKLFIAILAAVYSCWAILGSGKDTLYYGCLLLLSSVPIYAWFKSRIK